MITPVIFTLTSDFIQHIFLIVLVGLAFVEYIVSALAAKDMKPEGFVARAHYAKATRIILIIVVMATVWFIGEYFFDNYSLAYRLFLRWPLVIGILLTFIMFMRKNRANIPTKIFSAFAILLTLFIILDITNYFTDTPTIAITLAFERIMAMIAFFFSFLKYFMMNRPRTTADV